MYIQLFNLNLTVSSWGLRNLSDWLRGICKLPCFICGDSWVPGDNLNFTLSWIFFLLRIFNPFTTFSDGCLGSSIDEGRSKMRYAPWMAEFRESRECWTHTALSGYPWKYVYFRTIMLKWFQGNLRGNCAEFPKERVVVRQCLGFFYPIDAWN